MHKQTNKQTIRCVCWRGGVFIYQDEGRFLDFIMELALLCLLVKGKINTPLPHHQLPQPPIRKNRVWVAGEFRCSLHAGWYGSFSYWKSIVTWQARGQRSGKLSTLSSWPAVARLSAEMIAISLMSNSFFHTGFLMKPDPSSIWVLLTQNEMDRHFQGLFHVS